MDLTTADHFVVGISGGKDSGALLLWLLNESGIDRSRIVCTFADTGNEAPQTYDHVRKISAELFPVQWIRPERDFYELVDHKKRFPSAKARFCTTFLKLEPLKAFMDRELEGLVVSVNGMRRDESKKRSTLSEFASGLETYHGRPEWRPLLDWTLEDVVAIHARYNFPLNPLYAMGFERVGCMPCCMSKKSEIRLLGKHFPDQVDRIREAEGRNDAGSFFHSGTAPKRYRSRDYIKADGTPIKLLSIDDVIAWANTTDNKHRAQYDFHFEDFEEGPVCQAGACE
jgi:3'-phosphoadenosine 5'-phosphosulfate sulfotransferase (PAPS reductase)/FAD synthetase